MDAVVLGSIFGLSGLFTAAIFWLAAAIWS